MGPPEDRGRRDRAADGRDEEHSAHALAYLV
jgi:hypothetical protein